MGQVIEVEPVALGNVAIFDTDRSLTGQVGETYRSAAEARTRTTLPAKLAERIFEHDSTVSSVYVYSNTISVSRPSEWSQDDIDELASVIRNFLVYYEENRSA